MIWVLDWFTQGAATGSGENPPNKLATSRIVVSICSNEVAQMRRQRRQHHCSHVVGGCAFSISRLLLRLTDYRCRRRRRRLFGQAGVRASQPASQQPQPKPLLLLLLVLYDTNKAVASTAVAALTELLFCMSSDWQQPARRVGGESVSQSVTQREREPPVSQSVSLSSGGG